MTSIDCVVVYITITTVQIDCCDILREIMRVKVYRMQRNKLDQIKLASPPNLIKDTRRASE